MKIELGRFEGIPSETYHNEMNYAYSRSDVDAVSTSPSNLILKRKGPKVESDALLFGKAFHARMEFHDTQNEYLKLVAVPPSDDRRTVAGKAAHAKFEEESKGKLILDPKEWDVLENMLLAVKAHPDANALLQARGKVEETFVWRDPDTGVVCKCRPDKRLLEAPPGLPEHLIIDWKTTRGCDPYELKKSVAEFRYHVQAAFYLDGIRTVLGHDVGPFVNVFIEKGYGFNVVLGVLTDDAIEEGRRIYKANLQRIAECEKTGIWPGFVDLSLPNWAAASAF
jgi:exodeoxyribonuclease VIII